MDRSLDRAWNRRPAQSVATAGGIPVDASVLTQAARSILPYVQGLLLNSTQATDPAMSSLLHALASGS